MAFRMMKNPLPGSQTALRPLGRVGILFPALWR